MADDFEAQLQALESQPETQAASQPTTPTTPEPSFEDQLQSLEKELQAQGAVLPASQSSLNSFPSPEQADAAAQRAMRMQQFQAQIGESVLNLMNRQRMEKAAKEAPSGIAEKTLTPLFNAASTIGTAIKSATITPEQLNADPEVQQLLGARPGIPFDAKQGASFMDRLATQFTFNRAETAYALMAGNPNVTDVRFNQLGDPVMEVRDPKTGEKRDILANPVGLDAGDAAFLVAHAPEMVGGLMAAVGKNPNTIQSASKVMRWLLSRESGTAAASARMAGATAGAGAITDIGSRTAMALRGDLPDMESVNAPEVLARRGVGAVADFILGNLAATGGKVGTKLVSPFSNRGPIQIDAEAAQALWKQEGVDYLFTPGQQTGHPLLLRTEAMEAQKPGSSGVFANIAKAQSESWMQQQKILLGRDPKAVPPADLVGEQAMQAIGKRLTPLDYAVDRTTQDTLAQVNKELQANVANATGIPKPVVQTAVGQDLIKGADQLYQAFQAEKERLYNIVKQDPRIVAQGRNIDATPLANDAQKLIDEMAAYEKTVPGIEGNVTQVTRLTDTFNPQSLTTLQKLANAQGGRIGYSDLIDLRSNIGSALENSTILGGFPEGKLKQLYGLLTRGIEDGLDSIDKSGQLRKAWQTANDYTANETQKFKDLDILPIFKDATQRGAYNVYEVAGKALRDPGKWMAYREFYGPQSPQMAQLRRLYADKLTGRSIGSDSVDMPSFLSRLKSAYDDPAQRDVLEDALGVNIKTLKGLADAGASLEKGGTIPTKELLQNLQDGTLSKRMLKDLETLQATREQTDRNQILAKLRKGDFEVNPSKFVDNLIFSPKAEPSEVREALSLISDPQIRDNIAQRALLRVFEESTEGLAGRELPRSSALNRFLTDHPDGNMMGSRLKAAIGNERFDKLAASRDLYRPAEEVQRTFKAAGSLAAGTQIAKWEEMLSKPSTAVGALWDSVERWMLSTAYNYGPLRTWIGNNAIGPESTVLDRTALLNAFVGGVPAVKNFSSVVAGEDANYARAMAVYMKSKLDTQMREGAKEQPKQSTTTTNAPPQRP